MCWLSTIDIASIIVQLLDASTANVSLCVMTLTVRPNPPKTLVIYLPTYWYWERDWDSGIRGLHRVIFSVVDDDKKSNQCDDSRALRIYLTDIFHSTSTIRWIAKELLHHKKIRKNRWTVPPSASVCRCVTDRRQTYKTLVTTTGHDVTQRGSTHHDS